MRLRRWIPIVWAVAVVACGTEPPVTPATPGDRVVAEPAVLIVTTTTTAPLPPPRDPFHRP